MTVDCRLTLAALGLWASSLAYALTGNWVIWIILGCGLAASLGACLIDTFMTGLVGHLEDDSVGHAEDHLVEHLEELGGAAGRARTVRGAPDPNKRWSTVASQAGLMVIVALVGIGAQFFSGQVKQVDYFESLIETPVLVTFRGRIITDPVERTNFGTQCSFLLASESAEVQKVQFAVNLRVRASIATHCSFAYGDTIWVKGSLAEAFNRADDFGIEVSAAQSGAADGEVVEEDLENADNANTQYLNFGLLKPAHGLDALTNQLRAEFRGLLETVPLDSRGLVLAMAIGDEALLSPVSEELALTTGLTHLLVVSGGHFIILLGCVNALLKRLKIPKYGLWVMSVLTMVALNLIVHPQDSLLRASLMCLVGISAIFVKRRSQAVAALASTVIILSILEPRLVFSISFALSVFATAGIILIAPALERKLDKFLGQTLSALVAIPLAAAITSTPIILLINDFIPLYSVLANLLVAPVVTLITILGFAALLTMAIPVLGWALAAVACFFAEAIELVMGALARWPSARVSWWTGVTGALAWVGLVVGVSLLGWGISKLVRRLRRFETSDQPSGLNRWSEQFSRLARKRKYLKPAVLLIIMVPVLSVSLYSQSLPSAKIDQNWVVANCEVGQADSFALNLGGGHAVVIDVGEEDQLVDECLTSLGVSTIDLLVLSHFHSDHVGGLSGAIANRSVGQVWVTNSDEEVEQSRSVFTVLEAQSLTWARAQTGSQIEFDLDSEFGAAIGSSGANASANSSNSGDAPEQAVEVASITVVSALAGSSVGANDSSIILLVEIAQLKMAFLGDAETEAQNQALAQWQDQNLPCVDVVKVAHHGSKTQVEALYQLLSPRVALIGVGENTYGHPHPQTVQMLEGLGASVLTSLDLGLNGLIVESANVSVFSTKNPAPAPS